MKSAVLLLLAGACLCAQQQGSVEGIATDAVTHEPLSNVHVRLIAASFAGINGAYGAMSDRTGHFSIASIRPGTYILLPERPGYLLVQTKGEAGIPSITIKPGEQVAGYQLEMTPRAVLAGRVVDEAGDPVQGVKVQAQPAAPEGSPVVLNPAPNPSSDDRGEFRLIMPAGKYYLLATTNSQGGNERPEARTDGTSEVLYAATFYPSAVRKDRAGMVEAVAGKDVAGLEIRLARRQQGLSISGVITGIPEGQTRPWVVMQFGEKPPLPTNSRSTAAAADGKFKFESLQPGFYRIWAQYNEGKTNLVTRAMEWTLENTEISNVELALVPGFQVSGKVRVEGDTPGLGAGKHTVRLEPMLGFAIGSLQRGGGELDAEGMFRITNVGPSRYKLRVEPLAEGLYIKTVEIDGAASPADVIDLSNASKGVNASVLLGRNGVVVSGRVLDSNGERMPANLVMIYLIKEFTEILSGANSNGTAQAEPDGTYKLRAFAPGKYKLFAIDALRISGGPAVIDMLQDMFNRAEEVEFKEGEKVTRDLRVMATKEDPNAKKK
uniref:Cna B domain protein n=1 Tax=Solibacter usitatus (strain Ellin6076) TaxID=234267 RepID=Q028N6_SOLUE